MSGRPVARLVNKADFERLLATRWRGRSTHFALHHVPGSPFLPKRWSEGTPAEKLSTDLEPILSRPVDDISARVWFGCVVPKRHARRAVTRNMLKRQVRSAFQRHGGLLSAGLWLVRLRSPFAASEFVSARSVVLAGAARGELDGLLAQAAA